MNKKTPKYTDEPIGEVRIIDDFLPSPKELVLEHEKQKVTLSLTKSSIDFFKIQAKKYHTSYQAMIRTLVNDYAQQHRSDHSSR